MSNLYDLPKDMLIKLISTIENDTIKKYEGIICELIEDVEADSPVHTAIFCLHKDCNKVLLESVDYNKEYTVYKNTDKFHCCYMCCLKFCEDHKDDFQANNCHHINISEID